jgi:hypothetical protein
MQIFDPSAGSVLHLGWSRNQRRYSAEIEYSVVDLEHKIDATVTVDNVEYKATVRASDRDIKSLVVEVLAGKHYLLEAQVPMHILNEKFELSLSRARYVKACLHYIKKPFLSHN